jgi:hypothetical protein
LAIQKIKKYKRYIRSYVGQSFFSRTGWGPGPNGRAWGGAAPGEGAAPHWGPSPCVTRTCHSARFGGTPPKRLKWQFWAPFSTVYFGGFFHRWHIWPGQNAAFWWGGRNRDFSIKSGKSGFGAQNWPKIPTRDAARPRSHAARDTFGGRFRSHWCDCTKGRSLTSI